MGRSVIAALVVFSTIVLAPRSAAAQDTHLVIIVGVGGSEEHSAKFHKWASSILDAAKKRGVAEANAIYLGERVETDPARIKGRSTKENVTKAFDDLLKRAKTADEIFILLIGHGSFDGRTGAFNIPGPDLTAGDYGVLLDRFKTQRVAFVNTASSSGAFIEPLAGPNRTIVAATKTGGERNETRFAEYMVEALEGEAADRDRNGRVSVLEAFDFAAARTKEAYEKAGNLLSEHATLDDGNQGKFAATQYLAPRGSRAATTATADPKLRALLEERDKLEEEIAQFRLKKDAMESSAYEAQLEKLLTDLALKTRAIRELEAKK
jgi:hypothetical protein